MRHALLVALHLSLACWIVSRVGTSTSAPQLVAPVQLTAPPPTAAAALPAAYQFDDLAALDQAVDQLMYMIQGDTADIAALQTLALVDLAAGGADAAVGPLAYARTLVPEDPQLQSVLDWATARSGRVWDAEALAQAAREFLELVRMWGMGC